MGLDVYLYKYENKPETDRLENEYTVFSESIYEKEGKYDDMTTQKKDDLYNKTKEYATQLGLNEWGSDEVNKKRIEMDSPIDKEHYFKIGYFRSSYNGGGINRVLENLGLPGLAEILGYNDEYCFQPDWGQALQKCEEVIKALESKAGYRCFHVGPNIFSQPECKSEKTAVEIFLKELSEKKEMDGGYSNNKGEFFQNEPLKVLALIPGTFEIFKEIPCTYVITESENTWYVTALKIVKETIEYVLSQPDQDKYWLHWSS